MSAATASTATVPDDAHHLIDAEGTRLAWTVLDRDALRAEPLVRDPSIDPHRLARVAAKELAGMRVATSDQPLADALIRIGGRLDRHATVMTAQPYPSTATRPPPKPYEIVPFTSLPKPRDQLVGQLAVLRLAAYPSGHPDHEPSTDNAHATRNAMNALIEGTALGPLLIELSAIVRHTDEGSIHGAVLVTSAPHDAIWPGGPWIADLFIDPHHRGRRLGRNLLDHALHMSAELEPPRIGLAVTSTNPAAKLYRDAGFEDLFTSWVIHLPQTAPLSPEAVPVDPSQVPSETSRTTRTFKTQRGEPRWIVRQTLVPTPPASSA